MAGHVHHPGEKDLALLAGGDAGFWLKFRLERHVGSCGECRQKVKEFADLREAIAAAAEPAGLNWSQLEAEMRANIHLGFEAGQCVKEVHAGWASWAWNPKLGVAVACLVLLASAGFFLRGPHALTEGTPKVAETQAACAVSEGPVLESSGAGLELRSGAASLTLLNHHGIIAHQTVSARGEIRARYVDGDAGTVTINNVYLQ